MHHHRLIGLTGLAGCGKSTVADALAERGWTVVSLADPMKDALAEWFGWSHDRLYGPSEARNAPDPRWGGLTARRALQHLGTEFGRAMHPDVWIRYALSRAARHDRVVIPDVRFENEAAAVRAVGGRVVRIVRPGAGLDGDAATHASESGCGRVDAVLTNVGSLGELRAKAWALCFGGPA